MRPSAKITLGGGVNVLTDSNIDDYVDFPDFIKDKYKTGIISRTHFSDLLRLELLARYGGVWIDSTVLLTAKMPEYIVKAPLFVYQAPWGAPGKAQISNWLIASHPGNGIIIRTRELLYEYWKRNNSLKHYFIFHILFQVAVDTDPELQRQWREVPYFNNASPHCMQRDLFQPYSAERWEQLKLMSPIHKLTYKVKPEQEALEDTFYKYILLNDVDEL